MDQLAFRWRHSYKDSISGIEVPITLSTSEGRSVQLIAKVDTGAAFCIFRRNYADELGIVVEDGERKMVQTANGGAFAVYGHTLILSCLDELQFESKVYFAETTELRRDVVGRSGWLQKIRLGLIDHDTLLFLSHHDD